MIRKRCPPRTEPEGTCHICQVARARWAETQGRAQASKPVGARLDSAQVRLGGFTADAESLRDERQRLLPQAAKLDEDLGEADRTALERTTSTGAAPPRGRVAVAGRPRGWRKLPSTRCCVPLPAPARPRHGGPATAEEAPAAAPPPGASRCLRRACGRGSDVRNEQEQVPAAGAALRSLACSEAATKERSRGAAQQREDAAAHPHAA